MDTQMCDLYIAYYKYIWTTGEGLFNKRLSMADDKYTFT